MFDIDALFARSEPRVRELYERFARLVRRCGPVTVIPQKTRVAFHVRMRFAAVSPQKRALRGHLVLADRFAASCFERIETYSPRNHVHVFRLATAADLTPDFAKFVAMSYRVGRQEHLGGAGDR